MTTYDSAKLRADLIRDEGRRSHPYRCTAGKLTIGIGHNLDDAGISAAAIDLLYAEDEAACVADLDRALPWWRGLSEARQRALLNMRFNLGLSRMLGFKQMLAALQQGDYQAAAAQALDSAWAKQVGDRARRIAALIRDG